MKPLSKRQIKTIIHLDAAASLVAGDEARRYKAGDLDLIDDTIVVKTFVEVGDVVPMLSSSKNRDLRKGIIDFQEGKVTREGDGGTMTVDKVRITYAAGIKADDAAVKNFLTTGIPADIENAVISIKQGGTIVRELKVSKHVMKGDPAQKLGDDFVELDVPMVLVAGKEIKIDLLRPEGVLGGGTAGFIGLEFDGMKTFPKRVK